MCCAGVRCRRRWRRSSASLRFKAASTGKAQSRAANGNRTRTASTTHLCPYRQAVKACDERSGPRCRALPKTRRPGQARTVSSPARTIGASAGSRSTMGQDLSQPDRRPSRIREDAPVAGGGPVGQRAGRAQRVGDRASPDGQDRRPINVMNRRRVSRVETGAKSSQNPRGVSGRIAIESVLVRCG